MNGRLFFVEVVCVYEGEDSAVTEASYGQGAPDAMRRPSPDGTSLMRRATSVATPDDPVLLVQRSWASVMSMSADGPDVVQVTPGSNCYGSRDLSDAAYVRPVIADNHLYAWRAGTSRATGLSRHYLCQLSLDDPGAGWQDVCAIAPTPEAAIVADGWVYNLQPYDSAAGLENWTVDIGSGYQGDRCLRRRSVIDGAVETVLTLPASVNLRNLRAYGGKLYFSEASAGIPGSHLTHFDPETRRRELVFDGTGGSRGWSIGPDGLVAEAVVRGPSKRAPVRSRIRSGASRSPGSMRSFPRTAVPTAAIGATWARRSDGLSAEIWSACASAAVGCFGMTKLMATARIAPR